MRRNCWMAAFGWVVLLAPVLAVPPALGQGVFLVVDPQGPPPLPRPWIWPPRPPRPIPMPRPVPPPRPPVSYAIRELAVQARVRDQAAEVHVTQVFQNTGPRRLEVRFVFPLPYEGAVDEMTFLVDGEEYPARLLPADQARSIYEQYVRRSRDPALLEWIGTGMFQTSVFPVPPGAKRTVTIRYHQLLRRERRLTDFLFPLATARYTARPIERISLRVSIDSSAKITSVYSPTHAIEVKRPDPKRAVVTFEAERATPAADFRLFYDVAENGLGASVLSFRPDRDEDGYFLLLASPEVKARSQKPIPKTVILVIDRSGSMSGKKIEQAREALRFVIDNLREGDLFNIVSYASDVELFRPELERWTERTRRAAAAFAEGVYAGGGTNIDLALRTALNMVPDDDQRPSYVLFLTDGRPTTGETNEARIVENVRRANKRHARLISLGVGYDVNSRLIDRLSEENYGHSDYVRPDEDLEEHVSRLYRRISSPVMTDVDVAFRWKDERDDHGRIVNRVYPREVHDLFQGEQLVLVGRYREPGEVKVVISGRVGDARRRFEFSGELVGRSDGSRHAFVEKLWALRRIGEIIDELDLHGKNQELIDELVELSTKHGILTPYTSFLAEDNAPAGQLSDRRRLLERAGEALERLDEAAGRAAFAQRAEKQLFRRAQQAAPSLSFGGFAGGAAAAAPAAPGAQLRDVETDRVLAVDSVRQVGNLAMYRRGSLWIASNARDADPERDAATIRTVERFSDEYFRLVRENTREENALLALQQPGEELIVRLRGQLYRIR